ncbi:SDR family oxidoreductase [Streptomyces sp. NPDC050315]|uniref:SDR family oxidoreductase n=1 Tax=Streptomyces sp. NPDC050315 TaxID=3155039 RepID=UPI00343BB548
MPQDPLRPTVPSTSRSAARERPTVLLTGGSGVLGRALIDELSPDFDLVCLRRNRPLNDPRVREIQGDLLSPSLGLTPAARHRLALEVDVVLHSAAETSFRTPPKDIVRTNTHGTETMLDLAARADAPMYLVSTAFVASALTEEDRQRFPGAAAYLDSKITSEQMMRTSGLPGAIVRPSVVMGDSVTGRISAQQGLTKAIGSVVLGQVPVLPGEFDSRIDMIPQDLVTRAIGDLIRGGVSKGEYWLTAGEQAPLLREITDICEEFAVQHGLPRPARLRLIPVDAVHRLLLPMLEDTPLPRSMRQRFQSYAELLLVFQRELPFDTSLGGPDCGSRPVRADIYQALVRNLESWAEMHSALLRRHRVRAAGASPAEVAS